MIGHLLLSPLVTRDNRYRWSWNEASVHHRFAYITYIWKYTLKGRWRIAPGLPKIQRLSCRTITILPSMYWRCYIPGKCPQQFTSLPWKRSSPWSRQSSPHGDDHLCIFAINSPSTDTESQSTDQQWRFMKIAYRIKTLGFSNRICTFTFIMNETDICHYIFYSCWTT